MYNTQTGRDNQSSAIRRAFEYAMLDHNYERAVRIANTNPDIIHLAEAMKAIAKDQETKGRPINCRTGRGCKP